MGEPAVVGRKPRVSTHSLVLDLPPSCVEFCPAHPQFFVVGTYNLQLEKESPDEPSSRIDADGGASQTHATKQPQSRNGSLAVFQVTETAIIPKHTIAHPSAILDLHFHPSPLRADVFAVVSSTGTLSFFKLSPSSPTWFEEIAAHRPIGEDETTLITSCAWHPTLYDLLVITTSQFEVYVLRVDEQWGISHLGVCAEPIITHELEAWTAAFSPQVVGVPLPEKNDVDADGQEFILYSGGDDSKLLQAQKKYHPSPDGENAPSSSVGGSLFRGHQAGVTAILPLDLAFSDGSSIVVTGSYDDHIRAYRVYPRVYGVCVQRPQVLVEENLGGGVWRLKLVRYEMKPDEARDSSWSALILASCMHAGCRVLRLTGNSEGSCEMAILAQFEEHQSMNYGSDLQPGSEWKQGGPRCISTSFYDRLLCLWDAGAICSNASPPHS